MKRTLMFDKFPKTRPPLPREIKKIYLAHYRSNRDGQTIASALVQRMESWLHKQVAKDVAGSSNSNRATLELGAGTLNQLRWEPDVRPYDIVEPFVYLYGGSPLLAKVRSIYADISEVPSRSRYDRITSVATLEHVCNLPEVVARSALLLAEKGTFRAGIPSEGTFLWTLGSRFTSGLEFKLKYGLDYRLLMKHEHVSTAAEVEEVLEYCFRDVVCKVFGLSKSISFYRFYECRTPRAQRCRDLISRFNAQQAAAQDDSLAALHAGN
jgi:hypothetical protein